MSGASANLPTQIAESIWATMPDHRRWPTYEKLCAELADRGLTPEVVIISGVVAGLRVTAEAAPDVLLCAVPVEKGNFDLAASAAAAKLS
jgi:hypothetical protein